MPSKEIAKEVDIGQLRRELTDIYDNYRTASMNSKYYARRLTRISRFNAIYEATQALGASSTIATWSLWKSETGKQIWAAFAGLVGLLVVLKPFFKLHQKIEQFSKLHTGYRDLYYDLDQVVNEIKKTRSLTKSMTETLRAAANRFRNLAHEDEVSPSKRLLRKSQNEVNNEIPVSSLWYPEHLPRTATGGLHDVKKEQGEGRSQA